MGTPMGMWSRRSVIGVAIAAPIAGWGEPAPVLPAIADPGMATGSSGRNLLTIGVMIDGKGPFSFVVDTGADRSVVADTVARQLGLAGMGPIKVEGVVRTVDAQAVRVGQLTAGPVHRENLNLPILPRPQLNADGYLGLDVINGYRLSMDFARRELRLLDPRSIWSRGADAPNEIPVRLAGNGGHLHATDCSVDRVRTIAFIDSGAEVSVGNSRLYAALNARDARYARKEMIVLTGVTGGEIDAHITDVGRITVGGLEIDDSRIAIADLQIFRLWDLADRPAILIGMNWLRRFNRVSIDYGRKQLRFDLAARVPREEPLHCKPEDPACRYRVGSPYTMPRPSVAT